MEPLLEVGCWQLQPLQQVELLLNLLIATDQAAGMQGIHLLKIGMSSQPPPHVINPTEGSTAHDQV
jgi:hypothetical protein